MSNSTLNVSLILLLSTYAGSAAAQTAYASLAPQQAAGQPETTGTFGAQAAVQSLKSVLEELKATYGVAFLYSDQRVESITVPKKRPTFLSWQEELQYVLNQNQLQFERVTDNTYVISPMPAAPAQVPTASLPLVASSATAPLADITITGQVLDEHGTGLPGVNVIVKGTNNGSQTDVNGRYKITAPDNAILVFSFVGYLSKEVAVDGKTSLSLSLAPDASGLDEVVVVGYGVQEKKLLATSISSISAKQVELLPVASPAQALVGLVAGAQITEPSGEPGAGAVIRIRGLGSISAGNSPLYVVDGYPLNSGDSFSQISPTDIQSIQILKDAAACAIYGSRGGNGIVIVTTKRGNPDGRTRFNFTANAGVQQVAKRLDLLNRDQYLDYLREGYNNSGRIVPNALLPGNTNFPDTDWQDEIFTNGTQQQYSLSASGGSDKSRFYISGGYFKQNGIVKNSGFERFSLRANYDAQLTKRIKLGLSLAPNYTRTAVLPISGSYNGGNISGGGPGGETAVVTAAIITPPIIPVFLPNGDYGAIRNSNSGLTTPADLLNPVATIDLYQDRTNAVRALGYSYLDVEVINGLNLRSSFGSELIDSRRNIYVPATLPTSGNQAANLSNPILNNIDARQPSSTNLNWVWENTATYHRTFATNHQLTLLAGYSAQYNQTESSTVLGQTGTYTNTNIQYSSAAGQLFGQVGFTANSLTSVYGRLDYSFKERYILSAALRSDGSSRFGPDNRYAAFPSVAVAWRAGEEEFIKRFPAISELKLRGSFGVTGNNNIGDYNYQSYQAAANYVFGSGNGTRVFGFAPNGVAVRNLGWETNTQLDAGFDLGLFRDRIYLTVAAYQRSTTDLLLNRNVPAVLGFTTRALANVGEVRNRGLEFELKTANVSGKNFTWSTSANLTFNRNQVMALAGTNDQLVYDAVFGYTSSIRVVPGQSLGVFYGYTQEGIYRDQADVDSSPKWSGTKAQPGDIKFRDLNGDNVIDTKDIGVIGNPFPNFTYGMLNTFGYKNFSLSVTLQGSQGNDVLYGADRYTFNSPGQANARTNMLGRWHSPTDPGDGRTPRATGNANQLSQTFSSYFVYDASFLRVRNVTLRYNLPSEWAAKANLQSVGVYASAQNLYTFTKYFGYNPEANNYGNTTTPTYGVDQGSYPMARTITLGIQAGF
ncbi:MAG: SusC/RagA family TonB-linked outer membrane protein [Janthinobacterium lividum]